MMAAAWWEDAIPYCRACAVSDRTSRQTIHHSSSRAGQRMLRALPCNSPLPNRLPTDLIPPGPEKPSSYVALSRKDRPRTDRVLVGRVGMASTLAEMRHCKIRPIPAPYEPAALQTVTRYTMHTVQVRRETFLQTLAGVFLSFSFMYASLTVWGRV
ncbi:hypothetical protein F5Y15DRAFT_370912 [Xylariaceae sp. FL0016]|nr:hypothetical protein F5Y15DRAFT_370912 [Xylariaceae sp. FL0016]